MRKSIILLSSALVFGLSNLAWADNTTDDSTNTYTPSDQYNEKLHQKPVAEDANSGADLSTTKDESAAAKAKAKKSKLKQKKANSGTDTSTTNNY